MDINILKIASDTKNNKHIHNCTHSMKYKSQICGDEIEIFLIIKDNVIKDFSYLSQSCIYCITFFKAFIGSIKHSFLE